MAKPAAPTPGASLCAPRVSVRTGESFIVDPFPVEGVCPKSEQKKTVLGTRQFRSNVIFTLGFKEMNSFEKNLSLISMEKLFFPLK